MVIFHYTLLIVHPGMSIFEISMGCKTLIRFYSDHFY